MKRVIIQPTQYQGDTYINLGSGLAIWDFIAEQDMKFATTNDLNATPQTEADLSFRFSESGFTTNNGTNVWQEFTDNGDDHVAWQYDIQLSYTADFVGFLVLPFICQMEAANADSNNFQFLPCVHAGPSVASATGHMKASGTVIRDKNALAGAVDTDNVAFGILVVNLSGSSAVFTGLGSISVHPNSIPLTINQPDV